MAERNWLRRLGLTPLKAGLIVLLSCFLLVVMAIQLGGDAAPAEHGKRARRGGPAQRPPRSRPVQKQPAEPAKTVAVNAEIVPRKLWPRIPVEEVLQHDPLKLPAFLAVNTGGSAVSEHDQSSTQAQTRANAEAEMRQRHAKLTLLQQQGVNVIVSGPHGTSAMIGARQVHVGDDIDGFVITEIRPDGVVLTDPIEK